MLWRGWLARIRFVVTIRMAMTRIVRVLDSALYTQEMSSFIFPETVLIPTVPLMVSGISNELKIIVGGEANRKIWKVQGKSRIT